MSTPKPTILSQGRDAQAIIGSFLETKELGHLAHTCKQFQFSLKKTLEEKNKVTELLQLVFNADPKGVREFLTKQISLRFKFSGSNCIVLTKSRCKEGYYSNKLKRMMYKRIWENISPLEAAAWCGDNFLVRELLRFVPESYYLEAAKQLTGIMDRKESEENGSHLAPFKALCKAYVKFCEEYDKENKKIRKKRDYKKANKLWHQVWIRQRLLPAYGLQEYCDSKPFYNFYNQQNEYIWDQNNKEPKRANLCYYSYNPKLLDLDDMPFGFALCRGPYLDFPRISCGDEHKVHTRHESYTDTPWKAREYGGRDHYAIAHMCRFRKAELAKIIINLMKPTVEKTKKFIEQSTTFIEQLSSDSSITTTISVRWHGEL